MSTGVNLYMPIWYGDYRKDTTGLTMEQHGAYLLLLLDMWNRDGYLPDDPDELAVIVSAPADRWPSVWAKISRFFTKTPRGLTQKRLLEELERATERRRLASGAGRASAEARAQRNGNEPPNGGGNGISTDAPTEDPTEPAAERQRESHPPTPSSSSSLTPPAEKTRARATGVAESAQTSPPTPTDPDTPTARLIDDGEPDLSQAAYFEALCRFMRRRPNALSQGNRDATATLAGKLRRAGECTPVQIEAWGDAWWTSMAKVKGRISEVRNPTVGQTAEFIGERLEAATRKKAEAERFNGAWDEDAPGGLSIVPDEPLENAISEAWEAIRIHLELTGFQRQLKATNGLKPLGLSDGVLTVRALGATGARLNELLGRADGWPDNLPRVVFVAGDANGRAVAA